MWVECSPFGQKLIAKNYYLPIKPELTDKADISRFATIPLVKIDDLGGWAAVQKKHFDDGGYSTRFTPGNTHFKQ